MKRVYFSFIFLVFCLLCSCGGKQTANQVISKESSSVEEPDIELAVFDKVIAEKREEPVEALESIPVEKPKKEVVTASEPKKNATSKKKKVTSKKKKKAPKKYAKIEFDSVVHRLPTITEGDKFKDEFHFKNSGEIPLTITFATASCGCTLPSYPFLDIAPGESDVIRVEYNSVGKEGPQEAEITVSANTYPKEIVLKMVFDVNQKEKTVVDSIGQE